MIHAYKVAGHTFHLEMPDDSPLEALLVQYEPFVTETSSEPLFTVSVCDTLPQLNPVPVYDVPTEPGEPVVKLYRSGELWYAEMAVWSGRPVCARMVSDSGFRNASVKVESGRDALFGINNSLMLMFAFSTAGLDTLELHASVVAHAGKAFLFLGRSGAGKSTHSRQWLEYITGTHLLNDDNPVLRVMEDGSIRVFGSPWSGKTPCYRNEDYPIGGFVSIRQSPRNEISRLGVLEAYSLIYSSSSGFKADSRMSDGLHACFEKVISALPFYVLDCRPDREAAVVCHDGVCECSDR